MGIKIIEGGNNRFLSSIEELKGCLPDNVMLNKVVTGCGLTTMALTETRPYVVCVPYVSLVKNKEEWCRKNNIDVLAVYDKEKGGATKEDIAAFKGSKIIVTWNSLPKVVEALKTRTKDGCKGWKILIDECHQLVTSGQFRDNPINELLELYTEFGAFIFGTASPVPQKYQLPELREIQRVEVKWNNVVPITIGHYLVNKQLFQYVAGIALDFLEGRQDGNAHIFINSVKSIVGVVKALKKNGSAADIKIVCADNEPNAVQVKTIGRGYKIESTTDAVKKINFYTSTAFEGSDIYDVDGRIFVVSDGARDHTKIDIISTLPQIIGRIRNAKAGNVAELIYSAHRDYSTISEEAYEEEVKKNIEEAKQVAAEFNGLKTEKNRSRLLKDYASDPYITVKENRAFVNTTVFYSEMAAYSNIHTNCYSFIYDPRPQKINGTIRTYVQQQARAIPEPTKIKLEMKTRLDTLFLQYHELKTKDAFLSTEEKNNIYLIENQFPIIKNAYATIGWDKIKALEFNKKKINDEVVLKSDRGIRSKVVKLLDLRTGNWYSSKEIKDKLTTVYAALSIGKAAKATDIGNYYHKKEESRRIKGVLTTGYSIFGASVK